ncbi:MAG: LytTR family DNA-binding domain-containing protein [Paludibacter sp.]|jgi:two-component system LytT family response regulator|nr:LytTR family DNA-binding domain-containing protein [Paludibacter sp.]
MTKQRILIVDDEAPVRELITGVIENFCESAEIVGVADGVQSALDAIRLLKPDIVLLDVNLGDGTAFDLLSKIDPVNFAIIFITAYEKYAVSAFKFSAVDYIMKPVNIDELVAAIRKAAGKSEQQALNAKLKNFFDNLNSHPEDKKIVLKTAESIFIVKVVDIIRCEADHNYSTFYLLNGKKVLVSKTLKDYEEMLSDFFFFRTHQSHLININHIVSFEKNDGGYLRMVDGSQVPVSKRKREELFELFNQI